MAENPAGIILSMASLGLGIIVMATGWGLAPFRWIGGLSIAAGLAGLARIVGVL